MYSSAETFALQAQLKQYRTPCALKGLGQVATSMVPYLAGLILMVFVGQVSYLLSLLLVLPTAGFLIRVFIVFHDAGHGSFFKKSLWNRVIGYITGILTFTPFHYWTHEHAMHHATASDLDRRNLGDVWTMTVKEFVAASRGLRILYRLFRNPFVLFFLVAPLAFVFNQRIPGKSFNSRAKWAVLWTNLGVVAFVVLMSLPWGFTTFLFAFLPVFTVASIVGVWLFYVQHQFDDVYWSRHKHWDFTSAALRGSSYLVLPKVLQWFIGNINFHHIHHLDPGIPNYNLVRAQREQPLLRYAATLSIRDGLRSTSLRLYDETSREMVGIREGQRRAEDAAKTTRKLLPATS